MERGMPAKLKWTAIGVALLALGAAGAYRWPLPSPLVQASLNQHLGKSLGLSVQAPARAYLTLLPLPKVQVVDLELRGVDGAPVVSAPEARMEASLAPLLAGRLDFSEATLRRPTVFIDLDHPPFARDSAVEDLIRTKSQTGSKTTLGALRIERGLFRLVSARHGLDTLIEDVDGELEWPRLVDPLRIEARATWRGEPLRLDALLSEPSAWLAEGRSEAQAELVSRLGTIKLNGTLKSGEGAGYEGALSADAASIPALVRLVGKTEANFLPEGSLSLTGKAALHSDGLTLSEMRFTALNQGFEGAIALARRDSRLSISGSLAADSVRLDELLTNAPSLFDERGDWSPSPIPFEALGAIALDLRASVGKLAWRGHALQDVALSLMARDGGATATLSEATIYKGMLKGEASFSPTAEGVEISATASLVNADVGALVSDFGSNAYTGEGDAHLSFDLIGDSPATLMRSLKGEASVKLGPGVVQGLSFEEALRRAERRPINLFADMRTGRTVFNEASAEVVMERGEAHFRNAAVLGPGVCVTVNGKADLAERELATQISATRADEHGAPAPDGPQINVTIDGPFTRPIVKSDAGA
jgi:AsmA protein